jgi:hypothetical protein
VVGEEVVVHILALDAVGEIDTTFNDNSTFSLDDDGAILAPTGITFVAGRFSVVTHNLQAQTARFAISPASAAAIDAGATANVTWLPGPLASVQVDPLPSDATVGETFPVTLVAKDSQGNTILGPLQLQVALQGIRNENFQLQALSLSVAFNVTAFQSGSLRVVLSAPEHPLANISRSTQEIFFHPGKLGRETTPRFLLNQSRPLAPRPPHDLGERTDLCHRLQGKHRGFCLTHLPLTTSGASRPTTWLRATSSNFSSQRWISLGTLTRERMQACSTSIPTAPS